MVSKQLRMGISVEKEHSKTISFIENYYKRNKKFPSKKMIYEKIVKDHLKEDKQYYKKLKSLKL